MVSFGQAEIGGGEHRRPDMGWSDLMLTPHGALILVVDGGKMQLLRNSGSETAPALQLLRERHLRNPRDHVLDDDPPGRSFQSLGRERGVHEARSRHQSRKGKFGEQALKDAMAAAGEATPLVIIAPPHMLGRLRATMETGDRVNIAAEIGKDLGHHSPSEIAAFLHDWRA
jgi:protein required for attachment to host cells